MITFNRENYVFNYRVAGVAIHDNKVLVVKSILDDYWYIPGGRCEFLETSKEALKREMKEEIEVNIKIIRPLYFVENFYNHLSKKYHELSIFYLIEFSPDSKLVFENDIFHRKEYVSITENDETSGEELVLLFRWVHIDKIENFVIYPQFLLKSLKNIKSYPEHIINQDN